MILFRIAETLFALVIQLKDRVVATVCWKRFVLRAEGLNSFILWYVLLFFFFR